MSLKEWDLANVISKAISEAETNGFSLKRQMAFVQFFSQLQDLDTGAIPDVILKGMLNLITTIVRTHCNRQPNVSDHRELLIQNRKLGVKSVEILLKILKTDSRTL